MTYGLRHVAEIWCGTELGFEDTGVYAGLQGKTIDKITYYLNDGTIQTIAANIKVPKSTQNVTATVENALNTARKAVVTVENLPEDFDARYEVASGSTVLSAYNFTVANGKLTWTGTPAFGAYTLTITDKSGAYAPVSTTFELKTVDIIAKYDASKKALVKASDAITEEQFAAAARLFAEGRRTVCEGCWTEEALTEWTPEFFYAQLKEEKQQGWAVYLHCTKDVPDGMVAVSHKTGQVEHLFITADARGKGLGQKLLDFARKKLPEHAHPVLTVLDKNTRAIALYRRMGWKVCGVAEVFDPAKDGSVTARAELLEMRYDGPAEA